MITHSIYKMVDSRFYKLTMKVEYACVIISQSARQTLYYRPVQVGHDN